jgi:type 1 glutamine amidotransferase
MNRRSGIWLSLWAVVALTVSGTRGTPAQTQTPAAPAAGAAQPAAAAQPARRPPAASRKRVLVVGATGGWQHDSVTDSMVTVYQLGRDSGLWEAMLRTDYQLITKKPLQANGKNLAHFDAIVFASSTGEMVLDDEQKAALLSFVRDEGKGVVGIHAAIDANYKWPEFGEMLGGWFDEHPWDTFEAPILVEDADFPATRHFPRAFTRRDEIYQAKAWSRDKVNVLMRLDESKLTYEGNKRVKRTDRDFAVAWSKMYGKGRVFYSTLGHTNESWQDPDVRTMYFEAIKWVLGLTEGSTQSHPKPTS